MRVAVIGGGVLGLATTAALVRSGAQVRCYESVGPMSQRSAGPSRIFRLAHGSPELVGLAAQARRGYAEWATLAGAELVTAVGTVLSGPDVPGWASAMAAAGADHRIVDAVDADLDPPVASLPGPLLVDPAGGVVDARRTGDFLAGVAGDALVHETVRTLEHSAGGVRVGTDSGWLSYDTGVLAAGAQTGVLGAQVGIDAPTTFAHHVRFTFPLRDPDLRPPCLIEKTESWRNGVTTYQHLVAPGLWAVGAHLPAGQNRWELGREAVVATARRLTSDYVRENLRDTGAEPVDEQYCDIMDGWGDGFSVARSGAFLSLYGDNLFKLAPVLGATLADAALNGSTPASIGMSVGV